MEKRKRELEERRKMIDAKRRKKDTEKMSGSASTSEPKPPTSAGHAAAGKIAGTHPAPTDPFATLEAKDREKRNRKPKAPPANEADAFLAQLEQDFLASRKNK